MSSSSGLSKSFRLSSTLKVEEEAMIVTKNQGIGSILGSDCEKNTKSSSSLRRTLSADMSSAKWLTQQGFSPMKKIASSEQFSICSITDSSSSSDEELVDYDDERKETETEIETETETETETEAQTQFDIWSLIQEEVYKKEELEKPGQFDIWSSILSEKAQDANKSLPPPYIHPLVKRSASSLSKKSLEICTESLGSETGSDGFSSYPPSETGDTDDDKDNLEQQQQQSHERVEAQSFDYEEPRIPKYNYIVGRKLPQRSFPPPIPSISSHDGASIRMQSRRDNGRLVLEAVSVPSTSNFRIQRQDGRLVLTFLNSAYSNEQVPKIEEQEKEAEELAEEFENFEEEEEETDSERDETDDETEEEEDEGENESRGEKEAQEFVMEQAPKFPTGVINVRKLTLMGLVNRDPTWPNKLNEVVKFDDEVEEDVKPTMVAQSLPPPPRMGRLIRKSPTTAVATVKAATAAGASFNAYEYYWRPKPMRAAENKGCNNYDKKLVVCKDSMDNEKQQVLLLRGSKGDYWVPLLNGCKEPRRSLLFWEPHCIATS